MELAKDPESDPEQCTAEHLSNRERTEKQWRVNLVIAIVTAVAGLIAAIAALATAFGD
ncbi:hypothetical protein [Streptomyces sp. NPDC005283]|uniref:hypothetical protein n=1 Tax=Streptomyces sp. NPDC005283 TaxID=3156871 RepID=UPI003452A98B